MEVDAEAQPHGRTRDADSRLFRRSGRLLAVYWLAMFIGTHVKLSDPSSVFQIRDKVLHFVAYAGLAFLAAMFLRSRKGSVGRLELLAVWGVLAAYGVFDELTQIPVGRTADPLDWLADVAGAATGLVAFVLVRSRHATRDFYSGVRR